MFCWYLHRNPSYNKYIDMKAWEGYICKNTNSKQVFKSWTYLHLDKVYRPITIIIKFYMLLQLLVSLGRKHKAYKYTCFKISCLVYEYTKWMFTQESLSCAVLFLCHTFLRFWCTQLSDRTEINFVAIT